MKRLKVGHEPDDKDVEAIVECLNRGGVVALPTETTYGIGVKLGDDRGLKRLLSAVGVTSLTEDFTILVKDKEQAEPFLDGVSDPAEVLMTKFWPGRLTMRLVAGDLPIPEGAKTKVVSFRATKHPLLCRVLEKLDAPILSCNGRAHSEQLPYGPQEVVQIFGKDAIDCLVEAGKLPPAIAPSVVDLTLEKPTLVRHGAVPAPAIAHYIGALADHEGAPPLRFEARSDVGKKRTRNEDAMGRATASDGAELFCVADGMGGFDAGDVASRLAVAAALAAWTHSSGGDMKTRLKRSIASANRAVFDKAMELGFLDHMGTTIVLLAIQAERAAIAHVGDSRIYRLRASQLQQITEDHTEAQELVKQGKLEPEKADEHQLSNVLTRCLGIEEQVEPNVKVDMELTLGDTFLLCSDGLTGMVDDYTIEHTLRFRAPHDAIKGLIKLANDNGGRDNITSMLVRYGTDDGPLEAAGAADRNHGGGGRWILAALVVLALAAAAAWFAIKV